MISAHLLEWCFLGALSLLVGGIVFYRQWQSELDVDLTQADLTAALQTEEGARLLWLRAKDVVHALEWCGTHEWCLRVARAARANADFWEAKAEVVRITALLANRSDNR